MRDPISYRKYADECRRLANSMPEHKTVLNQMAEAWLACAEAAEDRADAEAPADGEPSGRKDSRGRLGDLN